MRRAPHPVVDRDRGSGVSSAAPYTGAVPPPAVEVSDLRMSYGTKAAVDGLSLSVEAGSITAVLGPNGAGKTTTLETCEGYRKPQSGTVRVLGLDPVAQRRELLPRIGVMLQGQGAWSGVRAMEMLRHIARLHATLVEGGLSEAGLAAGPPPAPAYTPEFSRAEAVPGLRSASGR